MEGRQFNRRTLAILVVLTALLLLFFGVLYNLQVLHVDDYRAQSVVKIANRKTVEAARGELLDRYGRSMVTNRATYQLTLNTGVMGEEAVRNANLLELLNICRDNGLTWTDTLAVSTAAPFTYTSDTPLAYEKEGGGVALTRLGRLLNALPMKKELKSSLNLPATEQVEDAKTLDDIPAGPTAEELIAALRTYFEIDPSWSDADARALIGVLYETNLRTYSINQQAYIFAQDVNIDVISAVKERRLTGVTIETTTVRQYNTVAAAHLLGHVGDIQSSNWDYYREQGYSMNDKVGIDGAENAFEEYLRGESGVQIQELSTSGKVVSEYWRIDPETAGNLHGNDKKRILRALEVWYETGRTMARHNAETKLLPPRYDSVRIGLAYEDREDMKRAIDLRVDKMVEAGLFDEVRALLASGLSRDVTAMQAIGYKEALSYLDGRAAREEAVEEIKLRSRQYAKRQLTWFRRTEGAKWLFWGPEPDFEAACRTSTKYLEEFGLV